MGNVKPSDPLSPPSSSSPAFLASTPERLYVRSGTRVASEAVAATRPRGAEGESVDMLGVGSTAIINLDDGLASRTSFSLTDRFP